MATKQEIIDRLSQCGGLSYQDWIVLLDSIFFDGDISDIYEPIKTLVLPDLEVNYNKISLVGSGTYTQAGQPPIVVPANNLAILSWDGEVWELDQLIPIPLQVGTETINPIGSLLTQEKAVAKYVEDHTPEMIAGTNLFNPERIVDRSYLSSGGNASAGTIVDYVDGWQRADFIPIEEFTPYTLSGSKERVGFAFYDENYQPTRYFASNLGTFNSQAGDKYASFNLRSPAQPNWSNIQFEKGATATAFVPYSKKIVKKESVEGLVQASINADQALQKVIVIEEDFESFEFESLQGLNLLDPSKVLTKSFLGASGNILTGTNVTDQYSVTDFIPTQANEIIQVLNSFGGQYGIRNYVVFNSSKQAISMVSTDANVKQIQIPNNASIAYIRLSLVGELYANAPGQYYPREMGVFKGTGNIFQYYVVGKLVNLRLEDDQQTTLKEDNSIATIKDIRNIIQENGTSSGLPLRYDVSQNGILTITDKNGLIQSAIASNRGYTGNNVFNFYNYDFKGVTASNGDDVAPIHAMNTTLGANHGYAQYLATISGHGFTNLDIGTQFTKGGKNYYIIRIVDANTVSFLGQNDGTDSNPALVALTAGVISRNGIDYTISSVTSAQLYPSIKNLVIKLYADGKEVQRGSSGETEKFEVVEEYEIKSIDSILQKTIQRVGQTDAPDFDGDGFIKIQNVYRFIENLNVLVFVRTRQLLTSVFADIMATQAITLGGQLSAGTYYYVPNSAPLNASVDLRKPTSIAWSSSIPSTFVVIANQPDPLNPPNRVIQYRNNVGFMVGYLKDRGVGKDLNQFTDRTFELRNNTGKIYPHPIEGTKVGTIQDPDSVYNIAMYRAFSDLSVTRIGNRLSVFEIVIDDSILVFVDYSGTMFDNVVLQRKDINGYKIDVVESKNCVLESDIYNDGFYVNADYIEGETSFIVLNIHK